MTEPVTKLDQALRKVAPEWDATRSERTLPGARDKRARRRRRAWAVPSAAVLLLCSLGTWAFIAQPGAPNAAVAGAGSRAQAGVERDVEADAWRTLAFADGSVAYLRGADTQLVVSQLSSALTEIALERGHARFEVTPSRQRRFEVHAGNVVVQVLGTVFEVAREATGTRVAVSRGRVALRWPNGALELGAGQSRWIPLDDQQTAVPAADSRRGSASSSPSSERGDTTDVARSARAGALRGAAQSWRQHAEQGDFKRAFTLLQAEREPVADDVEELLLAADAARLSGHPSQALPFLRKVVDRHDDDPRAPLAAFTLGGVLLNQLGHPREAQSAYARARALAPQGSLAQDALAREVEAAHRAGDPARARVLALDYLERYPNGRLQAVRGFGGLP
jgi:transmembrane sensor